MHSHERLLVITVLIDYVSTKCFAFNVHFSSSIYQSCTPTLQAFTTSGNLFQSSITLWLKIFATFNFLWYILRLFPLVIPTGARVKNLEQSHCQNHEVFFMFQLNLPVLFSVPA